MSVDITIKQQGVAQDIDDATKIHVSLAGSGSVNFVPVSDVQLQTLSVTQNGAYKAIDAGVYGFDKAIVNVPKDRVTGKIDGTEYIITVDENGYLVYTPVEVQT